MTHYNDDNAVRRKKSRFMAWFGYSLSPSAKTNHPLTDGSSAGISLFFSMLSCQRNIPIDPHCAFTGELDIHGKVYEIGGVIEKIQAAMDAGCTKVFIPASNYADLSKEDLNEFEGGIGIFPVSDVRDIFDLVFIKNEITEKVSVA